MILVDYNQIAIAGISQEFMRGNEDQFSPELARFFILNSIRYLNNKFRNQYGELIICADGGNVWRRDFFINYKSNRRKVKSPKEEKIWNTIFDVMGNTLSDLKNFFPYKVIKIRGIEADDIISYLSRNSSEETVIVSGDKDFGQLHCFNNIKQYSPTKKDFLKVEDPKTYLWEMIGSGDSGDGIPNILSDDDTFIDENKRQKPFGGLFKKFWLSDEYINQSEKFFKDIENESILKNQSKSFNISDIKKNFKRNSLMIDLINLPENVENNIKDEVNQILNTESPSFRNMMFYLMQINSQTLLDKINDFKINKLNK